VTLRCSCGVDDCRELGWPHEWDPVAAGDTCTITPPPMVTAQVGDVIRYFPPENTPHRVEAPYERWGSGYACVHCIALHAGGTA
jgi:hypothetical protein